MLARALVLAAAGTLFAAGAAQAQIKSGSSTAEIEQLNALQVVNIREIGAETYMGQPEIMELRKPNMQAFDLGSEGIGYRFFAGERFSFDQQQQKWFESAKVIPAEYSAPQEITPLGWLRSLFGAAVAYAQTYIAGANIDCQQSGSNWTTVRNSANGSSCTNNDQNGILWAQKIGNDYYVRRIAESFDTTALPETTDYVSSSSLSFMIYNYADHSRDSIVARAYTGDFNTTLSNYSASGTQAFASAQGPSSIASYERISFNLDVAGRSYIKTNTATNFSLACQLDHNNTAPTENVTECNYATKSADNATAGDRPILFLIMSSSTPTSTATTTLGATSSLSQLADDGFLATMALFLFDIILLFIILTLGYWLIDKLVHLFRK